jgi:Ni,Fe-hydrogenase III large subunit/Ni,Fe-hydrogenase III component G
MTESRTHFSSFQGTPLNAAMPAWHRQVSSDEWLDVARQMRVSGARLVALWGVDRRNLDQAMAIQAAYATDQGLCWVDLALPADESGSWSYPDLSGLFPAATRMQRAVRDLLGLDANGAEDTRPWLRHGSWPDSYFPLRRDHTGREQFPSADDSYPFVHVDGDGVHEIPVGPVHAGIIEPGHFRFSVVGEKILHLEERLGYTHKGIEKHFEGMAPHDGVRLAGRISGDATVAYAWAYCMALESLTATTIPARAQALRAIALERERVANHLGDLGALGNDAGFAFALAQFSRLREDWLRVHEQGMGHRLMMDWIVPGGVRAEPDAVVLRSLYRQNDAILKEVETLHTIFDEHTGLQDRFANAGRVPTTLASALGVTGLAARASGLPIDIRLRPGMAPYDDHPLSAVSLGTGDVAARVTLRFDEIRQSIRFMQGLLDSLPVGDSQRSLPVPAAETRFGVGWVESWRGEVLVALEQDSRGRLLRVHAHDPSWQNWPILEHAVMGNIVPDFPLINKSFNLSYSGQDL